MKTIPFFVLVATLAVPLRAQTIDDGIMMAGHALQVGNVYTRDSWDEYWEGALKRTNGNIGTIRTVIGLPNFPSYTSGHSTFSAAAADVLSYTFPNGAAAFDALKEEAAFSRLYGGIHYRSDIEVGKVVGRRVGDYTVRFAMHDGADR